ncbi:scabin-related ADP-ribosyltransferase [Kibdelosporangium phytohabitans]|uniref:J domain-containing protein n=1 Tax=Kibdelosporangium phytohabitans TaxID=860235 RepID=A0A0N9I3W1_9PSEU|nr:DnaJ domain-containing protein [Kibdelosporangium phytohabitans]ALG10354.1 hypothetical protein AOZ06_28760 [Kibdelosporangium phytohabitans]MBE1461401.1 hypothetical protein [Kibdelosporangium phytohabitans]
MSGTGGKRGTNGGGGGEDETPVVGRGSDMTTELPPGLQKFFKVTMGMTWPEASEGGLKAMSAAWADFNGVVGDLITDVERLVPRLNDSMRGVTADALRDYLTGKEKLLEGLRAMETGSEAFAKMCKTAAADVQKGKIMLIVMAAMFLATIIALLCSLFGAFAVPGTIAMGRAALQAIWNAIVQKLSQLTWQKAATALAQVAWNAAKYGAGGALFMGGLDLSIQLGQMAGGGRDEVDWNSVKGSTIGGAIGGAAFGAFHGITKVGLGSLPPNLRGIPTGGKGESFGKNFEKSKFDGAEGGSGGKGAPLGEKDGSGGSGAPLSEKDGSNGGKGAEIPPERIVTPGWVRGLGQLGYAGAQMGMVAASNPLVGLATGHPEEIWAGILGAAAPYHASGKLGSKLDAVAGDFAKKFGGVVGMKFDTAPGSGPAEDRIPLLKDDPDEDGSDGGSLRDGDSVANMPPIGKASLSIPDDTGFDGTTLVDRGQKISAPGLGDLGSVFTGGVPIATTSGVPGGQGHATHSPGSSTPGEVPTTTPNRPGETQKFLSGAPISRQHGVPVAGDLPGQVHSDSNGGIGSEQSPLGAPVNGSGGSWLNTSVPKLDGWAPLQPEGSTLAQPVPNHAGHQQNPVTGGQQNTGGHATTQPGSSSRMDNPTGIRSSPDSPSLELKTPAAQTSPVDGRIIRDESVLLDLPVPDVKVPTMADDPNGSVVTQAGPQRPETVIGGEHQTVPQERAGSESHVTGPVSVDRPDGSVTTQPETQVHTDPSSPDQPVSRVSPPVSSHVVSDGGPSAPDAGQPNVRPKLSIDTSVAGHTPLGSGVVDVPVTPPMERSGGEAAGGHAGSAGPVSPVGSAGPVSSTASLSPVSPVSPAGSGGPVTHATPSSPVSPVSPVSRIGSDIPSGPVIPPPITAAPGPGTGQVGGPLRAEAPGPNSSTQAPTTTDRSGAHAAPQSSVPQSSVPREDGAAAAKPVNKAEAEQMVSALLDRRNPAKSLENIFPDKPIPPGAERSIPSASDRPSVPGPDKPATHSSDRPSVLDKPPSQDRPVGRPSKPGVSEDSAAAVAAFGYMAAGHRGASDPGFGQRHGEPGTGELPDDGVVRKDGTWQHRRDGATPTRFSSERFDPYSQEGGLRVGDKAGAGQVSGKITQIRFDLRHFEVQPGKWVVEVAIPLDLISPGNKVPPATRRDLADRVQNELDKHFNYKHKFGEGRFEGSQVHFTLDAKTRDEVPRGWDTDSSRNVPVNVLDSRGEGTHNPRTNQVEWDLADPMANVLHKVFHFTGLWDGRTNSKLPFDRADGRGGIMGDPPVKGLTAKQVGLIARTLEVAAPVVSHTLDNADTYTHPIRKAPSGDLIDSVFTDGPHTQEHSPSNVPTRKRPPDDPPPGNDRVPKPVMKPRVGRDPQQEIDTAADNPTMMGAGLRHDTNKSFDNQVAASTGVQVTRENHLATSNDLVENNRPIAFASGTGDTAPATEAAAPHTGPAWDPAWFKPEHQPGDPIWRDSFVSREAEGQFIRAVVPILPEINRGAFQRGVPGHLTNCADATYQLARALDNRELAAERPDLFRAGPSGLVDKTQLAAALQGDFTPHRGSRAQVENDLRQAPAGTHGVVFDKHQTSPGHFVTALKLGQGGLTGSPAFFDAAVGRVASRDETPTAVEFLARAKARPEVGHVTTPVGSGARGGDISDFAAGRNRTAPHTPAAVPADNRPPDAEGGKADFRQARRDFAFTAVRARTVGELGTRTEENRGRIGIVATVAATPADNLSALAAKYAQGFDGSGYRGRFGLVIGVNGRNAVQVEKAVNEFRWDGRFPVTVVGFTWRNPTTDVIDQKSIPYGAIRETIARHPLTAQLVSQLKGTVYLHMGDADVHDFSTDHGPLFDAVDASVKANPGGPPEVLSGGYRVRDQDGVAANEATELDLRVREAMAGVDPRVVYFPEVNTFVRVTGPKLENDVTFGTKNPRTARFDYGAKEGQGLLDSILAQRGVDWRYGDHPKSIVKFDAGLAIRTDGSRIAANVTRDPASLSQSHARLNTWTDQVTHHLETHTAVNPALARTAAKLAFHDLGGGKLTGPELLKTLPANERAELVNAARTDPDARGLLNLAVRTRDVLIEHRTSAQAPPVQARNGALETDATGLPGERDGAENVQDTPADQPAPATHGPAERAPQASGSSDAAEMSRTHLDAVARDPELHQFARHVVGGMFTNKRGDGGRVIVPPAALPPLVGNVRDFYSHADQLRGREPERGPVTVYRAVMLDPESRSTSEFVEVLPSSASHSLSFVRDWTANRGGVSNYAVLEVRVPPEHRVMSLAYPPGYEPRPGDPREVNGAQAEVVLAPTVLRETGRRVDNGTTIISVDAHELPFERAAELIADRSPVMSTRAAFAHFTGFFADGRLQQAYRMDFHDARVRSSWSQDGHEYTATVERPGSSETFTITVRYVPPSGHGRADDRVQVRFSPSDDPDQLQEQEYHAENLNRIGAFLRGRMLQAHESFEALPIPSDWYLLPDEEVQELQGSHDAGPAQSERAGEDFGDLGGMARPGDGEPSLDANSEPAGTRADDGEPIAEAHETRTGSTPPPEAQDATAASADAPDAVQREQITPDVVRARIPEFLLKNLADGPARQDKPVEGLDMARSLLDAKPDLQRSNKLDQVQAEVTANILSFVGEDRVAPYQLTVGKTPYELAIQAEPQWDQVEVLDNKAEPDKATSSSGNKTWSNNQQSRSRDATVNPRVTATAAPPLVAAARLGLPTAANTAHESVGQRKTTASSKAEWGALQPVRVPVKVTWSLRDAEGNPVGQIPDPASAHGRKIDRSVTGTVDLSVPLLPAGLDASEPPRPVTGELPSAPAVHALYSLSTRSFFDQVAKDLPVSLVEIGSTGRRVLKEFLSDANIKFHWPKMAVVDDGTNPDAGWVRSKPVVKGPESSRWSNKASMFEMRAVPQTVQVIRTMPDATSTDSRFVKDTVSKSSTTSQGVEGTVIAGVGGDIAGAGFFAAGPVAGAGMSREHTLRHTDKALSKNSVETTGDSVYYVTRSVLQVRPLGGDVRTLDGYIEVHQSSPVRKAGRAGLGTDRDDAAQSLGTAVEQPGGRNDGMPERAVDPQGQPETTDVPIADPSGERNPSNGEPAPAGAAGPKRYPPAHVWAGESLGGTFVDDFRGGENVYRAIADVLRTLPGRKWYHMTRSDYVVEFGDVKFSQKYSRGLKASVERLLARGDQLKQDVDQIPEMIDTMLTDRGLSFTVTKTSTFQDYVTTVTLRAKLHGIESEGELDVAESSVSSESLEKREAHATRRKSWRLRGGALATAWNFFGDFESSTRGFAYAVGEHSRSLSHTLVDKTAEGTTRKHADTLADTGSTGSQRLWQFGGRLTITPEVRSYVRTSSTLRGVTPGRPGESVPRLVEVGDPTAGTASPKPQEVSLRLLVPKLLTTTAPPADLAPVQAVNVHQMDLVPHINDVRRKAPLTLDDVDVVAVRGTDLLNNAVDRRVHLASDDPVDAVGPDGKASFPRGTNSRSEEERLTPDSIRRNQRRFEPIVSTRSWERRRGDRIVDVAVVLTPFNPHKVSPSEYQMVEKRFSDASGVRRSNTADFTIGAGLLDAVIPFSTPTISGNSVVRFVGVFAGGVEPEYRWGHGSALEHQATRQTRIAGAKPVKQTLVWADVRADVVAEAMRKGNFDPWELFGREESTRSGESLDLPRSMLMWATDEQIAAMRDMTPSTEPGPADQAAPVEADRPDEAGNEATTGSVLEVRPNTEQAGDANAATAPVRDLPPPASVLSGKGVSLGLGGITTSIDLRDRIPHLRVRLAESLGEVAADQFLPKLPNGTTHDNYRQVDRFLADVHRRVNSALNGGRISPVRIPIGRWHGKTYYLTVDARFVDPPRFSGIEHVDSLSVTEGVNFLATESTFSGHTIATVTTTARPGVRLAPQPDPVAAGQNTGTGHAAGTLGSGLTAAAALGSRDGVRTEGTLRDHSHSVRTSGPMAAYTGQLALDLRIERDFGIDSKGHDEAKDVVATDTTSRRDVTLLKVPEESFPPPSGGRQRLGEAAVRPPAAGDGRPRTLTRPRNIPASELDQWRTQPGHVGLTDPAASRQADAHTRPTYEAGAFAAENYFGDVAELREKARLAVARSAGLPSAEVDSRTIAALKTGITPFAATAGLGPMMRGEFVVALPGHDLEIHARLLDNPKLSSVSAGVEIEAKTDTYYKDDPLSQTGHAVNVTGHPLWGGGGVTHPAGANQLSEGRGNFGSAIGNIRTDVPVGTHDSTFQASSHGRVRPKDKVTTPLAAADADSRITQVDLHDVEFRFVARPRVGKGSTPNVGIADHFVHEAYGVRHRPDATRPLPQPLVDAATRLSDAGTAWTAAAKAFEGLRLQQSSGIRDVSHSLAVAEDKRHEAEGGYWSAKENYDVQIAAARAVDPIRNAADAAERAAEIAAREAANAEKADAEAARAKEFADRAEQGEQHDIATNARAEQAAQTAARQTAVKAAQDAAKNAADAAVEAASHADQIAAYTRRQIPGKSSAFYSAANAQAATYAHEATTRASQAADLAAQASRSPSRSVEASPRPDAADPGRSEPRSGYRHDEVLEEHIEDTPRSPDPADRFWEDELIGEHLDSSPRSSEDGSAVPGTPTRAPGSESPPPDGSASGTSRPQAEQAVPEGSAVEQGTSPRTGDFDTGPLRTDLADSGGRAESIEMNELPSTRVEGPYRRAMDADLTGGVDSSGPAPSPARDAAISVDDALSLPAGSLVAHGVFETPADAASYFAARYPNLVEVNRSNSSPNCFQVTVQGSFSILDNDTFAVKDGHPTRIRDANDLAGETFYEATFFEIFRHMRDQVPGAQGMVFMGGGTRMGHFVLVHKDDRGVINFIDVQNKSMAVLATDRPVVGFVPLLWTGATAMPPMSLGQQGVAPRANVQYLVAEMETRAIPEELSWDLADSPPPAYYPPGVDPFPPPSYRRVVESGTMEERPSLLRGDAFGPEDRPDRGGQGRRPGLAGLRNSGAASPSSMVEQVSPFAAPDRDASSGGVVGPEGESVSSPDTRADGEVTRGTGSSPGDGVQDLSRRGMESGTREERPSLLWSDAFGPEDRPDRGGQGRRPGLAGLRNSGAASPSSMVEQVSPFAAPDRDASSGGVVGPEGESVSSPDTRADGEVTRGTGSSPGDGVQDLSRRVAGGGPADLPVRNVPREPISPTRWGGVRSASDDPSTSPRQNTSQAPPAPENRNDSATTGRTQEMPVAGLGRTVQAYSDMQHPDAPGLWRGADGRERPGNAKTWYDWIKKGERLRNALVAADLESDGPRLLHRLNARLSSLRAEYALAQRGSDALFGHGKLTLPPRPDTGDLRDQRAWLEIALNTIIGAADRLTVDRAGDGLGDLGGDAGARAEWLRLQRQIARLSGAIRHLRGMAPAELAAYRELIDAEAEQVKSMYQSVQKYGFHFFDRLALSDWDSGNFQRDGRPDITHHRDLGKYDAPDRRVSSIRPDDAFAAAVVEVDPDELRAFDESVGTDGVLWRVDRAPLYRSETRDPSHVFEQGMAPFHSENFGRSLHEPHLGSGLLVSATRLDDMQVFHNFGRYRYVIDAPGGVDLVATHGRRGVPAYQEVVFPGGIRREFIREVHWTDEDEKLQVQTNPHYRPYHDSQPPARRDAPVMPHQPESGPAVGVDGVSYPGPSRPDLMSYPAPRDGVLPPPVHRGEFEVETVDGKPYVRLYTVVSRSQIPLFDPSTSTPMADLGDVQQDPVTGKVTILRGKGAHPLPVFVGRPLEAAKVWSAAVWELAESHPWRSAVPPVIRSYLVPVEAAVQLSKSSTAEEAYPGQSEGRVSNVRPHLGPNQFTVPPSLMQWLEDQTLAGSLKTYTMGTGQDGLVRGDWAGDVEHVDGLWDRLGIPRLESGQFVTEWDPWPTQDELDGGNLETASSVAKGLRQHYATWQQFSGDGSENGTPALLEGDGPRPFEERLEDLRDFVSTYLPGVELRPDSVELRDFMDNQVAPRATQAAITELMASDYSRMGTDPNITGRGADNDFAALRQNYSAERLRQEEAGAEITRLWRDEDASPEQAAFYADEPGPAVPEGALAPSGGRLNGAAASGGIGLPPDGAVADSSRHVASTGPSELPVRSGPRQPIFPHEQGGAGDRWRGQAGRDGTGRGDEVSPGDAVGSRASMPMRPEMAEDFFTDTPDPGPQKSAVDDGGRRHSRQSTADRFGPVEEPLRPQQREGLRRDNPVRTVDTATIDRRLGSDRYLGLAADKVLDAARRLGRDPRDIVTFAAVIRWSERVPAQDSEIVAHDALRDGYARWEAKQLERLGLTAQDQPIWRVGHKLGRNGFDFAPLEALDRPVFRDGRRPSDPVSADVFADPADAQRYFVVHYEPLLDVNRPGPDESFADLAGRTTNCPAVTIETINTLNQLGHTRLNHGFAARPSAPVPGTRLVHSLGTTFDTRFRDFAELTAYAEAELKPGELGVADFRRPGGLRHTYVVRKNAKGVVDALDAGDTPIPFGRGEPGGLGMADLTVPQEDLRFARVDGGKKYHPPYADEHVPESDLPRPGPGEDYLRELHGAKEKGYVGRDRRGREVKFTADQLLFREFSADPGYTGVGLLRDPEVANEVAQIAANIHENGWIVRTLPGESVSDAMAQSQNRAGGLVRAPFGDAVVVALETEGEKVVLPVRLGRGSRFDDVRVDAAVPAEIVHSTQSFRKAYARLHARTGSTDVPPAVLLLLAEDAPTSVAEKFSRAMTRLLMTQPIGGKKARRAEVHTGQGPIKANADYEIGVPDNRGWVTYRRTVQYRRVGLAGALFNVERRVTEYPFTVVHEDYTRFSAAERERIAQDEGSAPIDVDGYYSYVPASEPESGGGFGSVPESDEEPRGARPAAGPSLDPESRSEQTAAESDDAQSVYDSGTDPDVHDEPLRPSEPSGAGKGKEPVRPTPSSEWDVKPESVPGVVGGERLRPAAPYSFVSGGKESLGPEPVSKTEPVTNPNPAPKPQAEVEPVPGLVNGGRRWPAAPYAGGGGGRKESLGPEPVSQTEPVPDSNPEPVPSLVDGGRRWPAAPYAGGGGGRKESLGPEPAAAPQEPRPAASQGPQPSSSQPRPEPQAAAASGSGSARPPAIDHLDDLYAVLGVDETADIPAIKTAYKKAALKYHPDKHPGSDRAWYESQFAKLNEAHEKLSDPGSKAEYDERRRLQKLQQQAFAAAFGHEAPGYGHAGSWSHPPHHGHYHPQAPFPGGFPQYHAPGSGWSGTYGPRGPRPSAGPPLRFSPPYGWATGTDKQGNVVYFQPGDVYQEAVRGWRNSASGRYITDIGVSFVTGRDGADMQFDFATRVVKLDRMVRTMPGETVLDAVDKLRDGTWVNSPWWKDYSVQSKARGRGPIVIDYHGEPNTAGVTVVAGSEVLFPSGGVTYVDLRSSGLPVSVDGRNFAYVQDGSWMFQRVYANNRNGSFAHTACWVASGRFVTDYLRAIASRTNGMLDRYRNESHFARNKVQFIVGGSADYEGAIGVDDNGGFVTGTPAVGGSEPELTDRPDTRYSKEEVRRIRAQEASARPSRPRRSSGLA